VSRPNFEWKIDETPWETAQAGGSTKIVVQTNVAAPDTPSSGERSIKPTRRGRRAALAAILILTVVGAAAAALVIVSQRAETALAPIRRAVLGSYQQLQYALAESDEKVFDLLLSRASSPDRQNLKTLFTNKAFIDRSALGLRADTGSPQAVEVNLSPDLTEAEVVVDQAYATERGVGITETARLRQTLVFRLDAQRQEWLLGAPGADFWGKSISTEGRFLTLTYPERDASIGSRLARDLDELLGRLCREASAGACAPDTPLHMRLDTRLNSLALALNPDIAAARTISSGQLLLPAPTLVGMPIDEAGYQALLRYYGRALVRQVVLAGFDRTSDLRVAGLIQTEIERQMNRLGLLAWPDAAAINKPIPSTLPAPDQDVALYCIEDAQFGGALLRYSPRTQQWTKEVALSPIVTLLALPGGDGLLMQELPPIGEGRAQDLGQAQDLPLPRIVLWRDGRLVTAYAGASQTIVLPWPLTFDPSGRRAILFADQDFSGMALLHLDRCSANGCDTTPLAGYPAWSPDGAQLVLQDWNVESPRLLRGDGDAQTLVEIPTEGNIFAFPPFWIDAETYGYVRNTYTQSSLSGPLDRTFEVVTASTRDDEPHTLATAEELLAALPEDKRPSTLTIGFPTIAAPGDSGIVLIFALAYESRIGVAQPSYGVIFVYDWRSREVRSFIRLDQNIAGLPAASPNGRWLAQNTWDGASAHTWLILYNLTQGKSQTFNLSPGSQSLLAGPMYDWSSDGRWLQVLDNGVLHLIAPDYEYEHIVIPASPGCAFAAWVNR